MATKKPKLPEFVTVFGHEIEVVAKPMDGEWGEFHIDEMRIYIDPTRTIERQLEILFHEMAHAVLGLGGLAYVFDEKTEEAIVRSLQYGLWPHITFKDLG